ncbi:MAG: hypothetical protein HRT93_03315 [Piscirickettsiaceae bacterium]|nr:hypothetical protein [Piscirickettsiaceae bacterium]
MSKENRHPFPDSLAPLCDELEQYSERWKLEWRSADEMLCELESVDLITEMHRSYLTNFIERWNMIEESLS